MNKNQELLPGQTLLRDLATFQRAAREKAALLRPIYHQLERYVQGLINAKKRSRSWSPPQYPRSAGCPSFRTTGNIGDVLTVDGEPILPRSMTGEYADSRSLNAALEREIGEAGRLMVAVRSEINLLDDIGIEASEVGGGTEKRGDSA